MAYEFKRLSDVTTVEAVAENTNVLIEEGGIVKKVNKSYVGEKVSDAALVEAATEDANVIIEENGVVKRVHKSQIGLTEVSWNDLKDKPFHEEGEMSEILPEMSFEFYGEPVIPNASLTFEEGADYIVIFNGQEYRCTAYIAEAPMTPSIGNGPIGDADARHNNEPFFVTVYEGNVMIFAAEPGYYTMSILKAPKVKTIDYKWMPKGYPKLETKMVEVMAGQMPGAQTAPEEENYCFGLSDTNELGFIFKLGVKYIVTINGERYETISYMGKRHNSSSEYVMLGDIDMPDNMPFVILADAPNEHCDVMYGWRARFGEDAEFSISEKQETITPMDPRFVGGGALTVIFDDKTISSGDDSAITCNVSVEEITQAVYAGRPIVSYLVLDNYYNIRQLFLRNGDPDIGFYTFETPMEIYDGTYRYSSYHIERDGTIEYSYTSEPLSGDS